MRELCLMEEVAHAALPAWNELGALQPDVGALCSHHRREQSIPCCAQRIHEPKSRMREIRTSGSVGAPGRDARGYPTPADWEGVGGRGRAKKRTKGATRKSWSDGRCIGERQSGSGQLRGDALHRALSRK